MATAVALDIYSRIIDDPSAVARAGPFGELSISDLDGAGAYPLLELIDRVLVSFDEILNTTNSDLGAREARSAKVRIVTLGRFAVEIDGVEISTSAWGSRQARQLCKQLAAARGWPVTRDTLIDNLWPDDTIIGSDRIGSDRLGARLSVVLSIARRILGDAIVADRQTVRLDLTAVDIDLVQLDANDDEMVAVAYTGDFLPEDRYEDWTRGPRDEARARFVAAAARLAADASDRGDHSAAVALARRIIDAERYDESGHQLLVRSLLLDGRLGPARRAYEDWASALGELGVEVASFDQIRRWSSIEASPRLARQTIGTTRQLNKES